MAGGRGYMPQSELPPRARRIQDLAHDADAAKGTTSACAENTERDPVVAAGHRNYLRVRGEYRPIVHNRRPHKGTTSACAENTGGEGRHRCRLWNYLRVRGEYNCPPCNPCNIAELPPRARRIPSRAPWQVPLCGTTSACAENTHAIPLPTIQPGNYLRVRGEYLVALPKLFPKRELPPRARRIHGKSLSVRMGIGTTSACAENTRSVTPNCWNGWNYLRVRGEYFRRATWAWWIAELPPRARRIPGPSHRAGSPPGTTSACAENTDQGTRGQGGLRNYLRVRGEYWRMISMMEVSMELPPRARRILTWMGFRMFLRGTTSACAENTLSCRPTLRSRWNYLRVRGEYSTACGAIRILWELPPRARRIPPPMHYLRRYLGTTSACAENTAMRPARSHRHGNYLRVRGEYWGI